MLFFKRIRKDVQDMNKHIYDALDVAKYIVNKCTSENRPITNLQLQKNTILFTETTFRAIWKLFVRDTDL